MGALNTDSVPPDEMFGLLRVLGLSLGIGSSPQDNFLNVIGCMIRSRDPSPPSSLSFDQINKDERHLFRIKVESKSP